MVFRDLDKRALSQRETIDHVLPEHAVYPLKKKAERPIPFERVNRNPAVRLDRLCADFFKKVRGRWEVRAATAEKVIFRIQSFFGRLERNRGLELHSLRSHFSRNFQ